MADEAPLRSGLILNVREYFFHAWLLCAHYRQAIEFHGMTSRIIQLEADEYPEDEDAQEQADGGLPEMRLLEGQYNEPRDGEKHDDVHDLRHDARPAPGKQEQSEGPEKKHRQHPQVHERLIVCQEINNEAQQIRHARRRACVKEYPGDEVDFQHRQEINRALYGYQ
jgi:hypothetical protein